VLRIQRNWYDTISLHRFHYSIYFPLSYLGLTLTLALAGIVWRVEWCFVFCCFISSASLVVGVLLLKRTTSRVRLDVTVLLFIRHHLKAALASTPQTGIDWWSLIASNTSNYIITISKGDSGIILSAVVNVAMLEVYSVRQCSVANLRMRASCCAWNSATIVHGVRIIAVEELSYFPHFNLVFVPVKCTYIQHGDLLWQWRQWCHWASSGVNFEVFSVHT